VQIENLSDDEYKTLREETIGDATTFVTELEINYLPFEEYDNVRKQKFTAKSQEITQ